MRASHILIEHNAPWPPSLKRVQRSKEEARLLAEELTLRILDGEALSDLALAYSDCPSKRDGGDLGRFSSGQMDKRFEEAVQEMEVGEVRGPVHTPFGWHVIRRTE